MASEQLRLYQFRLTMTNNNVTDRETLNVYLDSTLRAGWPARIAYETLDRYPFWPGFTTPVVSDLDNDGQQEIVVYTAGDPSKLRVFRPDGTLKWSKQVGEGIVFGFDLSPLIIDDINNDGKKEIIVYDFGLISKELNEEDQYSKLYAFSPDGTLISGWPVVLPPNPQATMLAADIDNDKSSEIIVQGHSGYPNNQVTIIKGSGAILSKWNLSNVHESFIIESTPAVGNFDDDPDLEIVVTKPSEYSGRRLDNGGWNPGTEGEIHVFNKDGSEVPGWPIKTDGMIFSSPAVGDINNDGKEDIVVGLVYISNTFPDDRYGGLYVFDKDGKVLPGWPVGKGKRYYSSPSLGDLDGDGNLEIATSRLGYSTEVYRGNGTLFPGWPRFTDWNNYYSTIIGDVNGDKIPDVITTAGNKVYAWKADGTTIPGFPKITEKDAEAPATLADIDSDGKLELIASSDWDFDWLHQIYKKRNSIYVWNLNNNIYSQTMYWPMFHRDSRLTGRYAFPLPGTKLPPCQRLGDIDLDGYITSADAINFTSDVTHVKRMVAVLPDPETGLPYIAEQKSRADVNNDQKVTIADAVMLLGYVNGAVETADFPACSQPTPTPSAMPSPTPTPSPLPSSSPVASSSATPTPEASASAAILDTP